MADKIIPTAARVRELLHYNPHSGVFTWAGPRCNSHLGKRAGFNGYNNTTDIRLDGRAYGAHRLAWLYMTGEWPVGKVRHANERNSDNRWANLSHTPAKRTLRRAAQGEDFSDIA